MSGSTSSRKPATYDDLRKVPDTKVAEIIDGELIVNSRPTFRNGVAVGSLLMELWGPFQKGRGGPGGWIVVREPELHLGADVLVPDIAGWRRERVPEMPDGLAPEARPDWVCEVLSPSTARIDRMRKLSIYGRERIPWAWLLDPLQRT